MRSCWAFLVLRNLIVVSTAPTTWPTLMLSTSASFHVLTLNLEVVGIGCLGALRLLFVFFFWGGFFSKENIHHYLPHLFSERTLPGDSSPFELCNRTIFQCIHHSSSAQGLGGAQTFIFQAMIFPGIMRASAVSGIWFKRASS